MTSITKSPMIHDHEAERDLIDAAQRLLRHGAWDDQGRFVLPGTAYGHAPIYAVLSIAYVRADNSAHADEIAAETWRSLGNVDTGEVGHIAGGLTVGPVYIAPVA